MKELTFEQIIKIVVGGTRDLSIHDGKCDVLQRLYKVAKECDEDGDPWILTAEQVILWAREEFNIAVR
jgi:hypothetical protein